MKNNEKIKALLWERRIPYWQIADVLNVHENTIGRLLRKPLTKDMEEKMLCAFNSIISAKENNS